MSIIKALQEYTPIYDDVIKCVIMPYLHPDSRKEFSACINELHYVLDVFSFRIIDDKVLEWWHGRYARNSKRSLIFSILGARYGS